ncbi:MAG: M56 family metallopeptidase [Mucilaginibacter sp.]
MEKLLYNVSQILGTTIIHSLWQGLLIYTALQLVFLAVLGLSAQKKHNLGMLALFAMLGWFGYTFYTEFNAYNWTPAVSNYRLSDNISLSLYNTIIAAKPVHPATLAAYKAEFFNAIKAYLPYIAFLYAVGLVINLGRLGLAWNRIRAIKKDLTGNLALQKRVNELARKLGVRKPVQLSFTTRIDGPCVISFVKPILLLPVTITTQLSADEVEAILMHELSHIQSNDYLLNLLQQLITVLLFFNPFAILISRIISSERENRCDDIVVQTTGDPLIYAQALLKLEETRQTTLTLALAATGKKYHLLTRIERIMKSKKPVGNFKHLILAMVILAGSLGSISWLNPEIKDGKIVLKRTAAKILPVNITTPAFEANAAKIPGTVKPKNHFTIVAADTTPISQLIDTPKKVKKSTFKIVLEDADGNKKEYSSVNDMPADARKEFLKENVKSNFGYKFNFNTDSMRFGGLTKTLKFNADSMRFGEFAKNFKYEMPMAAMENLKNMGPKMERMRVMIDKNNKDGMKKLNKEMKKLADEQRKYYTGPEFKKRVKSLEKSSADLNKMYDSPEWKKRIEDITKASTDFADKSKISSEDWAKSIQELTKQSTKFSQDFINSPEWKKYQDEIVKQALEVAKMQQGSAEQKEKIRQMVDKIREESRTVRPRFNMVWKADSSGRTERPEKAEKPEKAERPEKAEKPEKAERPEKKEKTESTEKPKDPWLGGKPSIY